MVTVETTNVYKDLKNVTECPICLKTYVDPRSLPCMHVLCINCLQGLVNSSTAQSENKHNIKCPLCQKNAAIPTPPEQFPVAFLVNSLTDIVQKSHRTGICQPCLQEGEDSAATWICFHCSNLLYKHCKKYHDLFYKDKNHFRIEFNHMALEYIAAIAAKKTLSYCVKHDKKLEHLCEDCQELLCVTCKLTDPRHKDHQTLYAKDEKVLQGYRQNLETFQEECTSLIQTYASCTQEVKDNGRLGETEIDGIVQKIELRYEEACTLLKQHKDELVKRANVFRQHHQFSINQKSTLLNQEVEQVKEILQDTKMCCQKGSYIDIINSSMQLKDHWQLLAQKPSAVIHKSILEEDFRENLTDLTRIFGELKCTFNCSITSLKLREFSVVHKDTASGLCLTNEGNIVVAKYGTNNIHIFTPDGELVSNLEKTKLLKKADNVQMYKDQIYVSDAGTGQVHIFQEQKYKRSIKTGSKGDHGIVIWGNILYATSCDEDCVYIIPLDNPTNRRVFAKHADMKGPGYITSDGLNIIISCSDSNNIFVYDLQGNLQFIHSDNTTGLNIPCGITTDSYYHIIVSDRMNKRVVFLNGGHLCGVIPTEGEPFALAIDNKGNIIVTTWDPLKVVTYSYQVKM